MLTGHGYRPDKGWGANVRFETWPGGRLRRLSSGARDVMRKLGCSAFHCSYFLPVVAMPNPMVTIHDVLPQTHPHLFTRRFVLACKHWFRFSVKRAQHVFTPSEYARESLIDFYGIAENKVSVTPCAVDFDFFFSGLGRDPSIVEPRLRKENYFLVVGRFDPRKDHATIVEAYSRLHARRPRCADAGHCGKLWPHCRCHPDTGRRIEAAGQDPHAAQCSQGASACAVCQRAGQHFRLAGGRVRFAHGRGNGGGVSRDLRRQHRTNGGCERPWTHVSRPPMRTNWPTRWNT